MCQQNQFICAKMPPMTRPEHVLCLVAFALCGVYGASRVPQNQCYSAGSAQPRTGHTPDQLSCRVLGRDTVVADSTSVAVTKPVCAVCNRVFTIRSHLYRHMRSLHPNVPLPAQVRPYPCTVAGCDRRFRYRGELNEHVVGLHPGVPLPLEPGQYVCAAVNCGKRYGCKGDLTQHTRSVHGVHKPARYECRLCNTEFATQRDVYRHRVSAHPQVFKCDACGVVCKNRAALTVHTKRAHPKHTTVASESSTGIVQHNASYKCEEKGCTKSYARRAGLQQHRRNKHPKRESAAGVSSRTDIIPDTICTCALCGEVYRSATIMLMHMNMLHSANTPGQWAQ